MTRTFRVTKEAGASTLWLLNEQAFPDIKLCVTNHDVLFNQQSPNGFVVTKLV
jgi:hypothetical protein